MAGRRGNAARKLSEADELIRRQQEEEEQRLDEQLQRIQYAQKISEERKRQAEEKRRREREKARRKEILETRAEERRMSSGFVFFAGVMMAFLLFGGVNYLQLKNTLEGKRTEAAEVQIELNRLKEENDEYYSSVIANVDMSKIKKIALGHLGMIYPTEEQVMEYETTGGSYVKQFQDVPEAK